MTDGLELIKKSPSADARYASLIVVVQKMCALIEGEGPNPTRQAALRELAVQAKRMTQA